MSSIRAVLAPGSLALFTLAIVAGCLALRWPRTARAARAWLAAWGAAYFLLALPVVAESLLAGLAGEPRFEARAGVDVPRVMVVLTANGFRTRVDGEDVDVMGADAAARVREAARVYALVQPEVVILTGAGPTGVDSPELVAMHEGLIARQVPADRIVIEAESRDTYQSAVATSRLLGARGLDTALLVTSREHMHRSARAFAAAGVNVVKAPAERIRPPLGGGLRRFVPSTVALRASESALHEYVGFVYYWLRGWV